MKFAKPFFIFTLSLSSLTGSANATYKSENGMKFYVIGSEDKAGHGSRNTIAQVRKTRRQPRMQRPKVRMRRPAQRSENPLGNLVKHTFVHLVPVWGGTKCGSRWTEIVVPDAFTSPMGNVSFARACAIHDSCYGAQKGRKMCDRQIYSNLQYECRRSFPAKNNHLRKECLAYSNLYFRTIKQFGAAGYSIGKTISRTAQTYRKIQGKIHPHARTAGQWITGRKRIIFRR